MSPEQVRGDPLDGRSDIFSLGCLLYAAAAGRSPFEARSRGETYSAVLTSEPAPLGRIAPDTSAEFQRVVRKCLEKDPARRYQTVREVAVDLRNLLRDSTVGSGTSEKRAPLSGKRGRRRVALTTAALVLAALAAGTVLWRGSRSRSSVLAGQSLAILPLKPLGSVEENYVGLGLADGVIARLSRSPGLAVRPTSAVRRYAVDATDAVTAGRDLEADLVSAGYTHLGLYDDWRRVAERAIARDPTNRQARWLYVLEHYLLNLPEEGRAAQKRLLNQEPDFRYFLLRRRLDEAAPALEARVKTEPGNAETHAELALLRSLQGRRSEVPALVARSVAQLVKNRYYHHITYTIARVYAQQGDAEEAARWLRETIDWGFPCYPMFSTDSFLDPVRQAPPVSTVLEDLKGVWEGYRDALR